MADPDAAAEVTPPSSASSASTPSSLSLDGLGDRVQLREDEEAWTRAQPPSGPGAQGAKRVLIVGASSGMGAGLARRFASQLKARVCVSARRIERLREVAAECDQLGAAETLCVRADVSDRAQCRELVAEVARIWGGIDVMVYCVGQAMHVLMADITHLKAGRCESDFGGWGGGGTGEKSCWGARCCE
jgi:NADPH:quinone reductase-like Zn-dependent oxidoreductase